MGALIDRIGLRMLVDGNGLADNFKNNSLYLYNKYQSSEPDIKAIDISNIQPGGFYHFFYMDDSNWMKWSPVFVTNYKKISDKIIIFAVNFNFIPLEIRAYLFDNFITEKDFDNDNLLKVDYNGMYTELIKFGFEYAIVEYNAIQIKLVHKISMDMLPRFLIAQHPKNKYDPKKLFEIWQAKINTRDKRNSEIMKALISDFYEASGEISEKYQALKGHIQRIQTSITKYG